MTIADRLFLLVLATLPIQLNKFFFLDHSYVLGIPIDYRALSLYFSDITIILFLAAFLIEKKKNLAQIYQKQQSFLVIFGIFILYLFLSSLGNLASLIFVTKIFLTGLLGLFTSQIFAKDKMQKPISLIFFVSLLWQSVLVITQFIAQRSQGLWFLGERSFDSATIGIAHTQILGRELLRPYGTFPHPNVAAAFLVIAMILFFALRQSKQKPSQIIVTLFAPIAIFFTFSQAALLVLAVAAIIITQSPKTRVLISLLAIIILGIFTKSLVGNQLASIAERMTLAQAALEITQKNPLFGVGSDQFIPELAKLNLFSIAEIRLLQPVHNIFFLILAENGVAGLLLFAGLLLTLSGHLTSRFKLALFAAILIFGSLDHFLWTLHQGQMLFWLTIGYILSSKQK